jgi:hypothetical protein
MIECDIWRSRWPIVAVMMIVSWSATGRCASAVWQMGAPIVTQWDLGGSGLTNANALYAVNGGYNLVWINSVSDMLQAQEHGLRGMYVNPNLINSSLLTSSSQQATLTATVNQLETYSDFYSYFVSDEPNGTQQISDAAQLVSYLKAQDPNRLGYVNVYGTSAFDWAGSSSQVAANYQTYLNEYVSTAQPSLISYDEYEFMPPDKTSDYLMNLAIVSQSARQAGAPFMNIVPAVATDSSATPNANQLQFLVYTTLAYGAQGINYWVGNGMSTTTYNQLTPLNHQFVAIASQLQSEYSLGAYQLGDQPPSTARLPSSSPFQLSPTVPNTIYVEGQPVKGFTIGLFGPDSQVAHATDALVVNLDYTNAESVTVTGPDNLDVFDATTGTWTAMHSHSALLSLPAGGGILVRWESIPGDLNDDGTVDQADYSILTSHWLRSVSSVANGDLNGDGQVNLADFALFKQDYLAANGGGASNLSVPVPEPAPASLWTVAALILLLLRVRRNQRR